MMSKCYVGLASRKSRLEGQYNDIRKHIEQKNNWKVVRIYKDPGLSGANLERPGLQKMLLHAKSRAINISN